MCKALEQQLIQEWIWKVAKHMRGAWASLAIKEAESKTTIMECHRLSARVSDIKWDGLTQSDRNTKWLKLIFTSKVWDASKTFKGQFGSLIWSWTHICHTSQWCHSRPLIQQRLVPAPTSSYQPGKVKTIQNLETMEADEQTGVLTPTYHTAIKEQTTASLNTSKDVLATSLMT